MPFVSEAQRRLMYAASKTKGGVAGVSQKAAKKLVAEDEPGKLPERVEKTDGMMPSSIASQSIKAPTSTAAINPSPGFEGSSASAAMMKAEENPVSADREERQKALESGDGSDMAKQLLAQINEMSAKLNHIIDSGEELEDWVDSKIVSAKKDLEDISGYLKHNPDTQKSIHGSKNTPDRTVNIVDSIAKADDVGDYEKKAAGALDFRNQMKQFRSQHGSTIMDIAGGRKIDKQRADAYHAARGQLMVGQGVSHADIPPRIPSHLIDNSAVTQQVQPPALPAAKSMEDLAKPKSLLQKMDDCTKCMRKNNEEELEKSSKKKSKPFHGYNKKKHARSGGLNDSYRKKLNRETGSNLKRPVTKKNVKPGSKAAKRRKSFCARMSGVKGPTSKKGKLTPKGAALKRWRCSKSLNKSESMPLELRADKVLKSLKSKLLAGAAAIGGLASGAAMASPESDLHSQLSNLNVMGEYHTPKSGSQTVLKEPNQLKADPTHPAASYSRESNSGSSMGSFHGPDAEKAKQLLQNYDAVNKCFTKSTGVARKKSDAEREEKVNKIKAQIKSGEYKPAEKIADKLVSEMSKKQELDKSNSIKPFGQNIYDANANLGRKMGRTGEEIQSAGKNVAVQQYANTAWGSSKEQSERSAKEAKAKSKKNPVVMLDLSEVPAEQRAEVISAYQSKKFHPLLDRAVKILNTKKEKTKKSETDKLVGGKGDLKNISSFDPLEVDKGKKVELEHTKDLKLAQEITKDHLTEDPKYYSKLKSAGLADELNKAYEVLSKLEKRCWKGYKPVPGKEPYSKGSCAPVKKAISAQDMESGKYEGEKLDAHHHNRIGKEYRELARRALKQNNTDAAKTYNSKSEYHFNMADKKGYEPPNE